MTKYDELLPLSPLTMAILLALADGDRHGYALMQEIEQQTDGALKPGTGSLYAGLQRLMGDTLMKRQQFCLPLFLAAYSGDPDLVMHLLDHGADPKQIDPDGNNIAHALVYVSIQHPDRALKVFDALVQHLDTSIMKAILLTENNQSMVALDIAGDLCLPDIIIAIFHTNGIYRHVRKDCGTHLHVVYDITRYMGATSCRYFSLLDLLVNVTEDDIKRMDRVNFLQSEPISSWIQQKSSDIKPYIFLWNFQYRFHIQ